MCGIVGAIAERNIVPILMEGLRRLEYRGYDSAGIAVLNDSGQLARLRTVGKVRMLQEALERAPVTGKVGIAHTRWATHGAPSERNAHPHISRDGLAIVHNGIIENHEELRAELEQRGYKFASETDTEVVAHRIHHHLETLGDLFKAVRATVAELRRRLRAGGRQRAGAGSRDRSPARAARSSSGSASRRTSSPRMLPRCCR